MMISNALKNLNAENAKLKEMKDTIFKLEEAIKEAEPRIEALHKRCLESYVIKVINFLKQDENSDHERKLLKKEGTLLLNLTNEEDWEF